MENISQFTAEAHDRVQQVMFYHDRVQYCKVDHDYWNEYSVLCMLWSSHSSEDKRNFLQENPIKRYSQKYPEEEHDDLVILSNHHRARMLDEIAIDVNALANSQSFSEESLKKLVCEVYRIIYLKEIRL